MPRKQLIAGAQCHNNRVTRLGYCTMTLGYVSGDRMPRLDLEKEDNSIKHTATSLACNSSTAFDCSICLEFVQDPVVTLCGHLYCWHCIYKWIHFNSISNEESDQQSQCPVCKAEVSTASLVPLYGKGKDIISSENEAPNCGRAIPKRPSAPICWGPSAASSRQVYLLSHGQMLEPHQTNYSPHDTSSIPRLSGTNAFQPIIEIFGEMVYYSRMIGQSITTPGGHSDSYNMTTAYTPRMRRQLVRADQSLSRLCFFFCCCMIMCLLLF